MAHYMEFSTRIYQIYLKYVAPEDIHVYSVDEVFIDATPYLSAHGLTARELARRMIREVLRSTGITATAGIGTNLYLCKIAMDIVAKHCPPDKDGVRIAELDERSYREQLWEHRPLTDFWRVGRGIARKLEAHGLYTMGDVARCSLESPDSCTTRSCSTSCSASTRSCSSTTPGAGSPAPWRTSRPTGPRATPSAPARCCTSPIALDKARLVVREMTDLLALDLVEKGLVTDQMELTVGYDISDYGRMAPKGAHGSQNLGAATNSAKVLLEAMLALFDRIVDRSLPVRRMYVVANHIVPKREEAPVCEQLDLFS